MIAGTLVVHIPKGSFNWIGFGTIRWQPQPLKSGMLLKPLVNRFGLMNNVVVDHPINPIDLRGRVALIQPVQQLAKQSIVFAFAQRVMELASSCIERTRQVMLLILPGCHHLKSAPLRHPLGTDFGQ